MSKLDAIQDLVSNDLRVFRNPFFEGMEILSYVDSSEEEARTQGDINLRWKVLSLDFFDMWRVSGIIGGRTPSRYSESPNLWNPYFHNLGVKGVFFAFDLAAAKDIPAFMSSWFRIPGALDLTVTDPYKHEVYLALQILPFPVSSFYPVGQTQAVNHLIFDEKERRIFALNTDGLGMIRALSSQIQLAGKHALLLGAGGSAASIGAELLRCRCSLWIANRTASRAKALAESFQQLLDPQNRRELEIVWSGFENIVVALPKTDILINTVSNGCPIEASHIARLRADVVLAETKYGTKADFGEFTTGRAYVDGRLMLFCQFVEAAETVYPLLGKSRNAHLLTVRALGDSRDF